MSAPSSPLGNALTGISSDAWYSIQAFASDYYLGLSNCTISHKQPPFAPSLTNSSPKTASPPTAAQLSDVEDPTLWQFIAAGPDTNRGVYALRSKTSQGRFCLVDGCEGPEICVEPPAVRECGNNAGQFQISNSSSDSGGVIFTTLSSNRRAALSVDANSSEGDAVDTSDILTTNEDETPTLATFQTGFPNDLLSASSSSSEGPTATQTSLTTVTPSVSGDVSAATGSIKQASQTTDSQESETSAPAQQTGSSASHTGISLKAMLVGAAFSAIVGLMM
ncbi:hypothetical protein CERZMDRAFT_83215 [Cercospora zeae-maydis SCOH1-5]|uniref:Uncharacterized protein n=1 Tax=Cercospora zeae-maydis SCOH1-5 TaxID=717836 RepID=A0A6A6FMC0_9PEZI|nr:hypothetical protein CERZMDRAFT_83215 [Cercospora zeae-maydis SCOH1-5]